MSKVTTMGIFVTCFTTKRDTNDQFQAPFVYYYIVYKKRMSSKGKNQVKF